MGMSPWGAFTVLCQLFATRFRAVTLRQVGCPRSESVALDIRPI